MNACLEELKLLKSIDDRLKLLTEKQSGYQGSQNGWSFLKMGKSSFFERIITYAGSTMNIDLDFPSSLQMNRIEQVWNDATARDYSIRMFTDASLAYYIELASNTTDTSLNLVVQAGNEYKYPSGSRLRLYYANFTPGKTVTIRVQVDDL